jgi:hypothetical protein
LAIVLSFSPFLKVELTGFIFLSFPEEANQEHKSKNAKNRKKALVVDIKGG